MKTLPYSLSHNEGWLKSITLRIWNLCLLVLLLITAPANAQDVLWGLSFRGAEGAGAIFSIKSDGTDFTVRKDFSPSEGELLVGALTLGTDDYLYGMTRDGGDFGYGTIYRIKTDGTSFAVIHHFNEPEGAHPVRSLEWSTDGYLYGATPSGGDYGGGTVFRIRHNGSDFEVLKHFDQEVPEDGYRPSELLLADNGDVYGIANGGEFFFGVIFRMEKDGSSFNVIHHFDSDSDGRYPDGDLMQGSDGFIYGFTEEGGGRRGTAYKLRPDGSEFTVLRSFNRNEEGFYPTGKLLEFPDGVFYGVLHHGVEEDGDGSIYRMNADGSDFTVLHQFEFPISSPSGGLHLGSDGFLYGLTTTSIYKIAPDGSDFEVVVEITGIYGGIRGLALVVSDDCAEADVSDIELDPASLVDTSTTVTASAAYTGEVESANWNWGDGSSNPATIGDTTITGSHQYTASGKYTITLQITDDCGTRDFTTEVTVSGSTVGSIDGKGMFFSPKGAYISKPQVKGMAHYSISAKTREDKISGSFQFKIADLQFRSSKLERLVVEDNRAWLYGVGKIKGKGRYGFLVSIVDEEDNRKEKNYKKWKDRGNDKLRVKIWNLHKDNRVVYDNQLGDPDEAVATQRIYMGSIVLSEDVNVSESPGNDFILDQLKKIKAYPNPASDRITIDLGDISPEMINTLLTDAYGTFEIRNLHRKVDGNRLEFDLTTLKYGTYYIRIQTENGSHSIKILKR